MADTTNAALLRAAADKLRAASAVASPGPWRAAGSGDLGWLVTMPSSGLALETEDSEQGANDADWIALMHPGVGTAVAEWLDAEAALWESVETTALELKPKGYKLSFGLSTHEQALAVAAAIIGQVSL